MSVLQSAFYTSDLLGLAALVVTATLDSVQTLCGDTLAMRDRRR